jgi:hypothetical protein
MRGAIVLAGLVLAPGCAVEHAQTDLIPLKRADRTSLREAGDVAVVSYAAPAMTFNGHVDQRAIDIRAHTGIEAPLDRVRDRVIRLPPAYDPDGEEEHRES